MKQVTGRIELHCANDQRTPRSTESTATIPFFLLSPRHSSKKIYLSSIRKQRLKTHWVQTYSVCERTVSVQKETRLKQFNTYCTWSHTQSTISKNTLVKHIQLYQVGMKRLLPPCGTWRHVVW